MQIKVSLDNINHEYLKNRAKQDRRTLSAELNVLLDDLRAIQPFTDISTTTQEKTKIKQKEPLTQPKENTEEELTEEEAKKKIKICADSLNLQHDDFSDSSYEKCKEFMEQVLNKKLTLNEMNKSLFDQAQRERGQVVNGNKKREI